MGDTLFYILVIIAIVFLADRNKKKPSQPDKFYYNPYGHQYYEIIGFKIENELVCQACLNSNDNYYEYKLANIKEPISPDKTDDFLMGWDIANEDIYFCSRCRKIFEFKDEDEFEFKDSE